MSKSHADKRRYEQRSKRKLPTRHHIAPRSRWGWDADINITMLPWWQHKGLHDYFGNKLPHEQILQILEDSNQALVRKFRKSILEILEEYDYENMIYKDGIRR